ncbi:SIS domain-containing protein [Leucobacter weissii]|uniref:SIS domain-containing protein n=1 Tax=Leucobacter weissii TaxID=1983706 RepID=A0A939S953_9MICO|nr:SIS domain-containing protein [Leucobacter weissii]
MDPASFVRDLNRIPETLQRLGGLLETGLPGLGEAERLGRLILRRTGRSPRILLLGMGSSTYAADVVAREAREAGAFVVAELASSRALPPPAEDLVVIAVSASGGSVEVLDAIGTYAGGSHADRLVAVTNRPGSELEGLASWTVAQHAEEEVSGIACRSFRHTLLVLRALVAALHDPDHPVRERLGGLAELARAGAEAGSALLEGSGEWLEPVAAALDAPLGTWVLAPVERLSSSRQSALMLREVPRRPAYASESGDWSHVDVYLTKTQDYRALIYAGSAWDVQALDWMTRRGSTWVSVGAGIDGAALRGAAASVRFPGEADPRVAQLAETLVAELVAAHWFAE